MNKWNNMDTWDKIQEVILWFLIFGGLIGSFLETTMLSFAILGMAIKLDKKIQVVETQLDDISTDLMIIESELKKDE